MMRSVCLIVLLALAQNTFGVKLRISTPLEERQSVLRQSSIEKRVNKAIDCIQENLLQGDESIGLPSFNPLVLEDLTVNLEELGIGLGEVSLNNQVINGIAGWDLDTLKINIDILPPQAKIDLKFVWPLIEATGDFESNSEVHETELTGSGPFKVAIEDFSITFYTKVSASLEIKALSLLISIGDAKLEIDGLLIDGENKSEVITETVDEIVAWINEHAADIDAKLSKLIMDIVNKKSIFVDVTNIILELFSRCW